MGRQCPFIVFPVLLLLATTANLHVVNAIATTTDSSVEHEVKAIAQTEPVDLPCDLGIAECNSTVHNIKVYKNTARMYVYMNSNDFSMAINKAEGDWTSPQPRAHLNLNVDPPVITLDVAYLVDAGRYKCEVTYVEVLENCRTSSYVNLIMLHKPSKPVISYDGDIVDAAVKRIGSFVEGTRLRLSCEELVGRPTSKISWWNGTEQFGTDDDAQLTINVILTRADLNTTFECQAMNEAIDTPRVSRVLVDVQVRPLSVEMSEVDAPVVEGDLVKITCVAEGARPEATILWFNGSKELASNANVKTEVFADRPIDPDGFNYTSTTRSEYSFKATMYDNGQRVHCQAQNKIMTDRKEPPLEDFVDLNVLYAPRVKLQPEGIVKVNYTDSMTMKCQFDANPANFSQIIWLKDGDEIDFSDPNYDDDDDDDDYDNDEDDEKTDSSDEDDDNDDYPTLRILRVTHLNKGTYSCKLVNSIGAGVSSTLLTLDVYYPPVTEIKLIPDTVKEHEFENVTLECGVVTANPPDANLFRWLKNGIWLAESENDTYVLEAARRLDMANYSCQAQNSKGWGLESEAEELEVQYLPGQPVISYDPIIAVKGKSVTLTCTVQDFGYPEANGYIWYRDKHHLIDVSSQQYYIETVTTQILSNFSCAALNDIGEGPRAYTKITATAPPNFIEKLPDAYGVPEDADDVSLTCHVECRPLCVIHWLENNVWITKENERYNITTRNKSVDLNYNQMDSVVSTLSWSPKTWPNGRLTRIVDNAEYKCITDEHLYGSRVYSTTSFTVQYPPERLVISSVAQTVTEGSIPEAVNCSADGLPQVQYKWTFKDDVVSTSNFWPLDFAISRNLGGVYTCIAFNRHGRVSADTFINVVYAPKCEIESEITTGGRVIVSCSVTANPSNVTFEWRLDNRTFTDNIETDGLLSRVTFHEGDEHYGNYTCLAFNGIEDSQPCSLEVSREGGWLEKISENKTIFVVVAVIGLLILFVVILVLVCLCKRKSKSADGDTQPSESKKKKKPLPSKEQDAKAFYENLPFHGLQPPPNKPFKPILPDLEYADVDFPSQPLNNNAPFSKAKIVERILEEADEEPPTGKTPARPPRTKSAPRN